MENGRTLSRASAVQFVILVTGLDLRPVTC
jgi:hypothetical protein